VERSHSSGARAVLTVCVATSLAVLLTACAVYEVPISERPRPHDSGMAGSVGGFGDEGRSGSAGSASSAADSGTTDALMGVAVGAGGANGNSDAADLDASNGSDVTSAEGGETGPSLTCAGYALQFDGLASYAVVMRVVQDDFTLEAWIKTHAPAIAGANIWDGSGLLYADQPYKPNQTVGVDDFGTSMLKGKFAFGVGNPDTTLIGTTDINTGAWVHIAATREKSTGTLRVMVNGVLDGARTVTAQTRSLTAPIYVTLGANIIDGHYWSGIMDEVRMWNVVRTPAEITSTMHKTLVGNEPGLVGYWKFDEGSGNTSADSSPTKLDATLISAPQFVRSDVPVCP